MQRVSSRLAAGGKRAGIPGAVSPVCTAGCCCLACLAPLTAGADGGLQLILRDSVARACWGGNEAFLWLK